MTQKCVERLNRQKHERKLYLRREDGAKFHKSEELNLRTFLLRIISFHVDEDLDILLHVSYRNESSLWENNFSVFNSF